MNLFTNILKLPRQPTFDDGLNVYLIVNTDLQMSIGKTGGQIGHAIQYLVESYYKKLYNEDDNNFNFYERYEAWTSNEMITKIVLGADSKEFQKIKLEYNPIVVKDAGKTEIEAGTETVICLYPMFRDERSKILKRLQVLKNI